MYLALFFTRNTSLRAWDDAGMFEREVALYRRLQDHGVQVTFVTYGDAGDLLYRERIPGIHIVCNRWGLSNENYMRLVARVHPILWRGEVVFKSNQVKGAEVALKAASRLRHPFVARCGYLHSDVVKYRHGGSSIEANAARALEQQIFSAADRVVVTTRSMASKVTNEYGVSADRIRVIPNYVDTECFRPAPNGMRKQRRICYVGRLEPEKNLENLMDAISGLDIELLMVGGGNLQLYLAEKARQKSLKVEFLGNIPNAQLPEIFNTSSLFVLPSMYEGHPKALLEAMACSTAVLGTDVPGIRDVIDNERTGILCGTSSEELRRSIIRILGDAQLQERLGKNAREFVEKECSLDKIAEFEFNLIEEVQREHSIRIGTSN